MQEAREKKNNSFDNRTKDVEMETKVNRVKKKRPRNDGKIKIPFLGKEFQRKQKEEMNLSPFINFILVLSGQRLKLCFCKVQFSSLLICECRMNENNGKILTMTNSLTIVGRTEEKDIKQSVTLIDKTIKERM